MNRSMQLIGTAAVLVGAAWLLRRPLESTMTLHMLVQWPLCLGAGMVLGAVAPTRRTPMPWDWQGVPGLLLATTVLFVWMLPRWLDVAVESPPVDLAKIGMLTAAGLIGVRSWRAASLPVRLFFAGNALWMTAAVGVVLQSSPARLCASYLTGDQQAAGLGLVILSIVAAVLIVRRLWPMLNAAELADSGAPPAASGRPPTV